MRGSGEPGSNVLHMNFFVSYGDIRASQFHRGGSPLGYLLSRSTVPPIPMYSVLTLLSIYWMYNLSPKVMGATPGGN